jgi:beta-lactamase regulating signal transducer with metallopeptidase domain
MNYFANWISPEILRTLGWTLLHFVWQGTALAALFAATVAACRSAAARYALAVGTLVLMMASPVITFMWLHKERNPAVRSGAQGALPRVAEAGQSPAIAATFGAPPAEIGGETPAAMLWLVEVWFLGVLLLSLRTAGGLFLIEKMRRKEIRPIRRELYLRCITLQLRMGLERVVRYCECERLEAPAVLGWFRPVVLLPIKALTGLNEEQIEAVIAHELAHIRRLDCFVNLFQIAAETLLFYHPAVWWVSQRIRAEREHCCDDEAIAICGDAVNYARALTLMEEWRRAPALLMAANRSPLAERVLRLLGLNGATGRTRMAGLGVSFVCLAGALLAGNAFLGVAHASLGASAFARQDHASDNVIVVRPEPAATKQSVPPAAKVTGAAPQDAAKAQPDNTKVPQASSDEKGKKESYLDAMQAAGFKNLSVDEIIGMKVQGVTPAYVKQIHEMGFQPSAEEFIGMRVQGITPEYIRDMQAIEAKLTVSQLIGMKVQGITAQYAQGLRELGLPAEPNGLIGMKVQGITPDYVREMRAMGLNPDINRLIGMKVQGITPEYVREIQATGLKPDTNQLIGMKVQGITPDYVKSMQAEGFKDLSCNELIGAKVQGITPEFIEKARKHGFQNLTLDKLIGLKHADIL